MILSVKFRFEHWRTCPVECRHVAALLGRIPQGEDLEFVSDLVLQISNFSSVMLSAVLIYLGVMIRNHLIEQVTFMSDHTPLNNFIFKIQHKAFLLFIPELID